MARLLTDEQHDFFVAFQKGRTAKEVAQGLKEKYGLEISANQVTYYRRNHNIKSGLSGHFQKGRVPHNKGKKYPGMPPNSGMFQKGSKPPNWVPVGTVRYTTDGYPKIKMAEPNVWELLHRKVWEEHHGPIPKGHSIAFLDGDRSNCDISNLVCLLKSEVARMNYERLFSSDPELTKAGIGLTRLKKRILEREQDGRNH